MKWQNVIVVECRKEKDLAKFAYGIVNQWEVCRGCDTEFIIDITNEEDFDLFEELFGEGAAFAAKMVAQLGGGKYYLVVEDDFKPCNPIYIFKAIGDEIIEDYVMSEDHKDCYERFFDYAKLSKKYFNALKD